MMMKSFLRSTLFIGLCVVTSFCAAQTPEFYFNGGADVILRYPLRGSGGRAIVHADNNVLTLNFEGDFTGGTRLGNYLFVDNAGSLRTFNWRPFGSTSDDFFLDVEPGTRILRTRNYNEQSPNVAATGFHTGTGYFENAIGIGQNPTYSFDVNKVANGNYVARIINSSGATSSDGGLIVETSTASDARVLSLRTNGTENFFLNGTATAYFKGNVGIGTTTPQEKLSVNGKIRAQEIKVETSNWPDYVFADDYKPAPLEELEKFIKTKKHLPEIPTAKEAEANGVNLGEMNKLLLKKVEELTLHLIEKDNQLQQQDKRIQDIESKYMYLIKKLNLK